MKDMPCYRYRSVLVAESLLEPSHTVDSLKRRDYFFVGIQHFFRHAAFINLSYFYVTGAEWARVAAPKTSSAVWKFSNMSRIIPVIPR